MCGFYCSTLKMRICMPVLLVPCAIFACCDGLSVSMMEGDSVTLNTNIEMNQQERIKWYFNRSRIAEILDFQIKICTVHGCKERFGDRLKVDNHTGSLTITNTTTTDSGEYDINSRTIDKTFVVVVCGVTNKLDVMKRKTAMEGESVTLDPGGLKNSIHLYTWSFKDIFIANITGDQTQICTDDRCKEIFRDRLTVDHHTGSLTITNINPSHNGPYNVHMINSGFKIKRTYSVIVNASFLVAIAGKCAGCGVIVLFGAAGLLYLLFRKCRSKKAHKSTMQSDQVNGVMPPQSNIQLTETGNETSLPLMHNSDENSSCEQNKTDMMNTANGAI